MSYGRNAVLLLHMKRKRIRRNELGNTQMLPSAPADYPIR